MGRYSRSRPSILTLISLTPNREAGEFAGANVAAEGVDAEAVDEGGLLQ